MPMRSLRKLLLLTAAVVGMIAPSAANAAPPAPPPTATQLLTGLEGGSGSTVGPGGALYVTESAAGRISRVDPRTGEITTFASGLPGSIIGIGGTTDVAFLGGTAYALVTVVGPDVGGSDVVGIYRIDGPDSFTVVASGAPLLVDVEFGRGRDLYALSQGSFGGGPPGSPAAPNTGSLVKVNGDGTFSTVVDGLDRPTSVEFIRNTAYVVTLTGEIWKVENPSG